MLKVALSTSSSGSSGEDDNADEQPRCPAPRWRLDPGDAGGAKDFRIGLGNKLLQACCMVAVMMRDPDLRQVPTVNVERCQCRCGITSINQRSFAAFAIVEQDTVIVLIVTELVYG